MVGGVAQVGVQGAALPGIAARRPSLAKIIVIAVSRLPRRPNKVHAAGAVNDDNAPSTSRPQLSPIDSLRFVASSSASALFSQHLPRHQQANTGRRNSHAELDHLLYIVHVSIRKQLLRVIPRHTSATLVQQLHLRITFTRAADVYLPPRKAPVAPASRLCTTALMTYYRDNPYAPNAQIRTPLIDLIPDNRDELDVSDEEDSFYGKDDDFLIPTKWQNRIDRLPRRIKRYFIAGLAVAFLLLISWWVYFGPRHAAYREEVRLMEEAPAASYGHNLRPDFKDMIQVKDMDEQHLPKKGKRLVFVGDVHGCKEELEHLLKKVEFRQKHDHLVLAGDMITKGRRNNMTRQCYH